MKKPFLAFLCLFTIVCLSAQEIKYGKVTAADFNVVSPLIDSSANAIVISDIGSSEFTGNTKGWFSLLFKRHKRIKILNKNGFDAATVSIHLYANGSETERVNDLRAVTYNLENGTVVPVKMESKSVFENRLSKNSVEKKFTLPSLQAGSIIEYTYTIESDFIFNLQPWAFQGEYPCLLSKYEVSIPDFFGYVTLTQGYLPFADRKTNSRRETYSVSSRDASGGRSSITSDVQDRAWEVKNAPALKEENFTTTINNHISKIEFQLAQYRFPNQPTQEIMGSWPNVSEKLLKREDFGVAFTRNNGWLDEELKLITRGATNQQDKAKLIYAYVRDNFTCNSNSGIFLSDGASLKDVYKKKGGQVGDINLLLLAMLRHESINANPVLVSTRGHGKVHPVYPLMGRFNYVVCQTKFDDGSTVYLDASRSLLGYNQLPANCYNGLAFVLGETPNPISLEPDSLVEAKATNLIIMNGEKGFEGTLTSTLGERASYRMREKMLKTSKTDLLKEIGSAIPAEIKASNLNIDSLKVYEEPVSVSYTLHFDFNEDVIYFNPLMGEAVKKNPFTSAKRLYPVEMPSKVHEVFVMNMEIPKGYAVDEMPKSVRYKLNEDEGMFEYIFAKSADRVQMRCRIDLNKANFTDEDYEPLREFFAFVIQKQNEQIVFKKTK
jgi:transglutaminase-like putative cysteine protease